MIRSCRTLALATGLVTALPAGAQSARHPWNAAVGPVAVWHASGPVRPSWQQLGGSVRTGAGLEGMFGFGLRGVDLSARSRVSWHDLGESNGNSVASGSSLFAQFTLSARRPLGTNDRLVVEFGGGAMYGRSRWRAGTVGDVIGLPGSEGTLREVEWAPVVSSALDLRLVRRSDWVLALRAGADIAFTRDARTVLIPVGLQLRR